MNMNVTSVNLLRGLAIFCLPLLPYLPLVPANIESTIPLSFLAAALYLYESRKSNKKIEKSEKELEEAQDRVEKMEDELLNIKKGDTDVGKIKQTEDGAVIVEGESGNLTQIN